MTETAQASTEAEVLPAARSASSRADDSPLDRAQRAFDRGDYAELGRLAKAADSFAPDVRAAILALEHRTLPSPAHLGVLFIVGLLLIALTLITYLRTS